MAKHPHTARKNRRTINKDITLSPTDPSLRADGRSESHFAKSSPILDAKASFNSNSLHGGEVKQETIAKQQAAAGMKHNAAGQLVTPWPKSTPVKITDAKGNTTTRPGPHVSTDIGSTKKSQPHTAAFSEMIGAYTTFGLDPEQDNFDALDLMAQHIIDLLLSNVYEFANLTRFERNLLYRYFYKTNPIIHRCLDLHTDLPLSKVRLQDPSGISDLASDYIMQFFNRVLERLNFPEFLREFVLAHNIYGDATALIDDYYKEFDRVLEDISKLEDKTFSYSEEDERFIQQVDTLYNEDPKKVKLADRLKYIDLYFNTFFEPDYLGPDRMSVVPFYKVQEFLENKDINYMAIKYQLSESLNKLLAAGVPDDFLEEVGYSEGMIATLDDPELRQDKTVTIDTDPYDGMPFIINLQRPEGSSNILCILEQGLEWEATVRSMRAKIENIGKVGRIIWSEGLSEGQTDALKAEVHMMMDDPGYVLTCNFEVHWEEVNTQVKQQLDDLIAASSRITEILHIGLGMPMGLISGDSEYAGSVVKLEIVNVVYHSFKQRLQSLIEVAFFRPIAIRKGFIRIDEWGNPIVCYPRLTFSRISLRDESVYDLLFSLYQKQSLPVSVIYDILNLDTEDVKRGIEADFGTMLDPNMGGIVRELMSANLQDVYNRTDLSTKIIKGLNLPEVRKDTGATSDFLSPGDQQGGAEKPAEAPENAQADGTKPEEDKPGSNQEQPGKPEDVTTYPQVQQQQGQGQQGLPTIPSGEADPNKKVQFERDKTAPGQLPTQQKQPELPKLPEMPKDPGSTQNLKNMKLLQMKPPSQGGPASPPIGDDNLDVLSEPPPSKVEKPVKTNQQNRPWVHIRKRV